jgi:histidine kinase/DNA gyrase B/HSP90-like ATPase/HsdM-like protein
MKTERNDDLSAQQCGGDLPFARTLFEAADRMRGSVESAEYKHLVLGLLFLKYISDSFERRRAWLQQATHDPANEDYFTEEDGERHVVLEDRDEYISENVFGCRRRHAGRPCSRPPPFLTSASGSTRRSTHSNATTRSSCAVSSRRSTRALRSSQRSSASSSAQSQRSASAMTPSAPATSSGARTSTSSASSPQRNRPGVVFRTDLSESVVHGIPSTIQRAVGNLLDNAGKWSSPGGEVDVIVRDGKVIVRDHGPGIADEDLPHIFDRFYRARSDRRLPVSGLGLAIVRQIARAHGGEVVAERAEGGGTRMTLRLNGAASTCRPRAPG